MQEIREETFRRIRLVSDTGYKLDLAEDGNELLIDESGLNLGAVGGTHNMTQYIDRVGQNLDSTVLSPRDIEITGWIIGPSVESINRSKVRLSKAINPFFNVRLEYNDYALDFQPDTSIQFSTEYLENNSYMCKFLIQGTAPMPLWRLKTYHIYRQNTDRRSDFHFAVVIPKNTGTKFGYAPVESVYNMPNFGDVESGMLITITALDRNIMWPRIVNETAHTYLDFKYFTLAKGDSLEINTELGNQSVYLIHGNNKTSALKYLTLDSSIDMTLKLGYNTMRLYDSDGLEVGLKEALFTVKFSPRFLEVEGR